MTAVPIGRYSCVPSTHAMFESVSIQRANPNASVPFTEAPLMVFWEAQECPLCRSLVEYRCGRQADGR